MSARSRNRALAAAAAGRSRRSHYDAAITDSDRVRAGRSGWNLNRLKWSRGRARPQRHRERCATVAGLLIRPGHYGPGVRQGRDGAEPRRGRVRCAVQESLSSSTSSNAAPRAHALTRREKEAVLTVAARQARAEAGDGEVREMLASAVLWAEERAALLTGRRSRAGSRGGFRPRGCAGCRSEPRDRAPRGSGGGQRTSRRARCGFPHPRAAAGLTAKRSFRSHLIREWNRQTGGAKGSHVTLRRAGGHQC